MGCKREGGKAVQLEEGDKEWETHERTKLMACCCACRKNEKGMVAGKLMAFTFHHEKYIGIAFLVQHLRIKGGKAGDAGGACGSRYEARIGRPLTRGFDQRYGQRSGKMGDWRQQSVDRDMTLVFQMTMRVTRPPPPSGGWRRVQTQGYFESKMLVWVEDGSLAEMVKILRKMGPRERKKKWVKRHSEGKIGEGKERLEK